MAVPSERGLWYGVGKQKWVAFRRRGTVAGTDSRDSLLNSIRVFIVDDYAAVRQAVATVLEAYPDLEMAGEASDVEEALQLVAFIRPDVVLLDISLPGIGGAAATRAILNCSPSSRVIATCTLQEEELIPEALSAGAVGCLLKNVSANELASAIRAAYATPVPNAHTFPHGERGVEKPQVEGGPHRAHRNALQGVGRSTT
jgi:CheY-like chemotaxis protein